MFGKKKGKKGRSNGGLVGLLSLKIYAQTLGLALAASIACITSILKDAFKIFVLLLYTLACSCLTEMK